MAHYLFLKSQNFFDIYLLWIYLRPKRLRCHGICRERLNLFLGNSASTIDVSCSIPAVGVLAPMSNLGGCRQQWALLSLEGRDTAQFGARGWGEGDGTSLVTSYGVGSWSFRLSWLLPRVYFFVWNFYFLRKDRQSMLENIKLWIINNIPYIY